MFNLFRKHRLLFAITILLNIVLSVVSVAAALLLEKILNATITHDWLGFSRMMIITPVYLAVSGIIIVLASLSGKKLIVRIIRTIREDLHNGILTRDPETYQSVNTAEYISALTNDVKTIEENALIPYLSVIQYAFIFVVTVAVLIHYNPVIAGIMFLCLLIMYIAPAGLGKAISRRQDLLSKSFAMFTVGLKDQLSGYDVIRSFQLSKRTAKAFTKDNADLTVRKYEADKFTSFSEGISQTLAAGSQLLIMLISGYMVLQGKMTAGVLLALLQLSGSFVQPVGMIMQSIAQIQGTKPVLERILDLSRQQPSAFSGTLPAEFESKIGFEEVSFGYQTNQPVLENINLSIEKNKKYAIIL